MTVTATIEYSEDGSSAVSNLKQVTQGVTVDVSGGTATAPKPLYIYMPRVPHPYFRVKLSVSFDFPNVDTWSLGLCDIYVVVAADSELPTNIG